MIKSFHIRNFKNIENLEIPLFKRINLIVGKNSVGKSTLLEAISIYLADGDESYIRDVLRERGESISLKREDADYGNIVKQHYLSLFSGWREDYSKDFCINLEEAGKDALRIRQVYISEFQDSINTKYQLLHQEDVDGGDSHYAISSKGLLVEKAGNVSIINYNRQRQSAMKPFPFQMVMAFELDRFSNAYLFDKVSLSSDEDYIIKALNIINPDIERIAFVADDNDSRYRIPKVSLRDSDKRVRLSSMGDGLNRVLTIILSLLNAKDGVLLLDEFEAGLHYSIQKKLWEIIFFLAEELNVQVFVTTHSSDSVRSFGLVNQKEQGLLIRLEQRTSGIVSVGYEDNSEIVFAAENQIELR